MVSSRYAAYSSAVLIGLLLVAAVGCRTIAGVPIPLPKKRDPYVCAENAPSLEADLAAAQQELAAGQAVRAGARLQQHLDRYPKFVELHELYQDSACAAGGAAEANMRRRYEEMDDDGSALKPFFLARLAAHEAACKKKLEEALKRDASFYPAHVEMARMRIKVGQPNIALRSLRQALEIQPDCARAERRIGRVYLELRQWKPAERHLRRYLRKLPNDQSARIDLARVLIYRLGRAREAAKLVNDLVRERPEDMDLWMDRAAVHWYSKELDDAAQLYRRVLRRDPNYARAALNLGDLYFDGFGRKKGKRADAWSVARNAYRYFVDLDVPEEGLVLMNRVVGARKRLRDIETVLGPLPENAPPVSVSDI